MKKIILYLFFLFLPTQLAYHYWPNWALIYGLRVDYLAPAIYFSDLLFLLLVLVNFNYFQKKLLKICKSHFTFLLIIAILFALNIYASQIPQLTIIKLIKYFQIILIIIFIHDHKSLSQQYLKYTLNLFIPFLFLISLFQIINKSSFNGLLYFLGERRFSIYTPGISLVYLNNHPYLRPYAIFSHPNSLAGFSLALFFLNLNQKNKSNLISLLLILLVILSFSQNAFFVLILCLILLLFSQFFRVLNSKYFHLSFLYLIVLISFLMMPLSVYLLKINLFHEISYLYRLELSYVAGNLFSNHFLFGVGLNNFLVFLPSQYSTLSLVKSIRFDWWIQPVHNIYQLILIESGLPLFVIMITFLAFQIFKIKNSKLINFLPLFSILLTGLFDHYWITLQQNQLLFAIILGLLF